MKNMRIYGVESVYNGKRIVRETGEGADKLLLRFMVLLLLLLTLEL